MREIWRVFHWGPLLALTIIFTVAICSTICNMMWWDIYTVSGAIHMIIYVTWLYLILYNFFCAMFIGPGHVPLGWEPENDDDKKDLQYCSVCKGYKAPRSHHCRKCNRCVLKMDHHCPWINNCCGHLNHGRFTLFLLFAPLGCIHSAVILISSIYHAMYMPHYVYYGDGSEPIIHLGFFTFLSCLFSIGLSIAVIIAVGGLFYIQMKSIIKNETGIDSWIIEKAIYRERKEDEPEFVYPYNLGRWNNIKQVFTWNCYPVSDGFTWEVIDGCDQFSLTREQIKQKQEKRERSVEYIIIEPYSGWLFPCTKGCRVCCCIPCTDEARIKVEIGDRVLVSRGRKHWLYGERLLPEEKLQKLSVTRIRGWFPRRCAAEFVDDSYDYPNTNTKLKTS